MAAFAAQPAGAAQDARLKRPIASSTAGGRYVHLEGTPLRSDSSTAICSPRKLPTRFDAIKLFDTHQTQRDWEFFRTTARQMLWPHIDAEYQQELQGIADGAKAHGVDLDVYDIVALNAFEEVPDYYVPWLNKQRRRRRLRSWTRRATAVRSLRPAA